MLVNHLYLLTCGIGKEVSVAFLGKKDGTCLKECWKFSHCFDDYQKLIKGLNPQQTLVAFEATGHYWLALYEFLIKKGFEVVVLNPLQVKSFRDSGIRGSKTDKLDAKLIFNLLLYSDKPLALGTYSEKIIELRNLCRMRHKLSQQKTLLTNKLISILDIVFPEYQKVLSPKSLASLSLLKKYPSPDKIASLSLPKLTQILNKGCKGRGKPEKWAKGLKEKASQTIGSKLGLNTFSLEMKIIIQRINQTAKQIKLLNKEIKRIFTQLPESKVLLTIPGVSDILGATILAEIGDINRFRAKNGADKIVALAGLDGKVKESGKSAGKTKMSKRGSTNLRWALWQAATVALRCDPSLKEVYLKQKAKHKHYYVCVSHVAKKLARIVYSVLVNKSSYQPFHSVTRH
jgi:transposase